VNGTPYEKNYVRHTDLLQGMTMDYSMGDTPNTTRGTDVEAAPYSFSDEYVPAKKSKSKSKKNKKK
jgi:putative alpha-1,2-mannosidase